MASPGLYFMIFQYHDAGLMLSLIRLLACLYDLGREADRSTDRWRTGTGWGGGVNECVTGQVGSHLSGAAGPTYEGPLGLPQPLFDPLPSTLLLWQGLLPGLGSYENLGKC